MFTHLNTAQKPPKKGDVIVIETKRNKGKKVILKVADVVDCGYGVEVIVSNGQNKYFNWEMFLTGDSWVWRVWNLGEVQFTSITNTMTRIDDL
ncbi:MAG: hypothetical protein AAGJ67_18120 [Pseudomonadota bacterium]